MHCPAYLQQQVGYVFKLFNERAEGAWLDEGKELNKDSNSRLLCIIAINLWVVWTTGNDAKVCNHPSNVSYLIVKAIALANDSFDSSLGSEELLVRKAIPLPPEQVRCDFILQIDGLFVSSCLPAGTGFAKRSASLELFGVGGGSGKVDSSVADEALALLNGLRKAHELNLASIRVQLDSMEILNFAMDLLQSPGSLGIFWMIFLTFAID